VVELAVNRFQAGFDIPQTLAVRQLSKCDTKELPSRKSTEDDTADMQGRNNTVAELRELKSKS